MEEEKSKKMTYINENLIEKGYNPEELSNFIIKKTGIPMEHIKFEQLKQLIEEFKDQILQNTYKTIKSKDATKTDDKTDDLYASQTYDFNVLTQQKNKLIDIENEFHFLNVNVSESKKEKSGGIFSRAVFSYKIDCEQLKTSVRRTYNDFEWLREQLLLRYPLRFVSPLIKENNFAQTDIVEKQDNEEIIELKKVKYLNLFMKNLLKKKIFRTSPIVLEFLELDTDKFKKYKNLVNNSKYELSIKLENLNTVKGKIHCEMKKEDVLKADQFNKKYTKLAEIYSKLEKCISNIVVDIQNLEKHLKEVSDQFNQLTLEIKDNQNAKPMENIYTQLKNLFENWSNSCGKQHVFFKENFKNVFKYMGMEYMEMDIIHKNYLAFKNEYEDFTQRINKKKTELFEQKDYKNWSLKPGTEKELPMFQNNKKIAFEKMLYKETYLLVEEKKRVACTVYLLFKQFDKLLKHQSENISNYFEELKTKNKAIVEDTQKILELFEIKNK